MIDSKVRTGIIGVSLAASVVLASLQYQNLPFINTDIHYSADFADAGGLMKGDVVQVAGINSGQVSSIDLDGDHVKVTFTVASGISLGDRSLAAIKTTTLLGRKALTVVPVGSGAMHSGDNIPTSRTTSPYSLNDALGDLSSTVKDLDTDQLNKALETMSNELQNTPAPLRSTLVGMSRLSKSLNDRDQALRDLLTKAQGVTKVLADRSNQINSLLVDGNQLLGELDMRRTAITELIGGINGVSIQLRGLVRDEQNQLKPTLDKLDQVLALLQKNKTNLDNAIDGLEGYSGALAEQVGSGPYFESYMQNYSNISVQVLVDTLVRPDHLPADLQSYIRAFTLAPYAGVQWPLTNVGPPAPPPAPAPAAPHGSN